MSNIPFQEITPLIGARIPHMTFEEMMAYPPAAWRKLLYARNVIVVDQTSLSREQLLRFSFQLGHPWPRSLHTLHGESIEEDMVVNWSDQSGLRKMSLPWHTDNPWHPRWYNPIRILYGVQIPDKLSGRLFYLDLCHVYNHVLSASERAELDSLEVLIQDYKTKDFKRWMPLVRSNPVTGRRGVFLTAMDFDCDVFGFKKNAGYEPGNTFLLKVRNAKSEELQLQILVDYALKCMETPGAMFSQEWQPGMVQIISNLDSVHHRTALTDHKEERLIWRKTIAHELQGVPDALN